MFGFRGHLVVLGLVLSSAAVYGGSDGIERRFDRALVGIEAMIERGDHVNALRRLNQLRTQMPETVTPRVERLHAEIELVGGHVDAALARLKPWTMPAPEYSPKMYDDRMATAELLLRCGQPAAAARVADWLIAQEAAQGDDGSGNLHVFQGLALLAAAEEKRERYEPALKACSTGIRYARRELIDYVKKEPLRSQLAELIAQQKRLERLIREKRFGVDFLQFREAERLRRHDAAFNDAFEKYNELIQSHEDSPFVEPAKLYAALCLARLDRTREAEKSLEDFIKTDPLGLYRGEAHVELVRLALENRFDLALAKTRCAAFREWVSAAPQHKVEFEHIQASLRPGAKQAVRPPSRETKKPDFWGNLERTPIEPGDLWNRVTCDWYMSEMAEQCVKFEGFIALVAGDQELALAKFREITQLDPLTAKLMRQGEPNDASRLIWAAKNGYFYAYPTELKAFRTQSQRLAIMLADFYYVTKRFDAATGVTVDLSRGKAGRLSPDAKDYVDYLTAACQYWQSDRDAAFGLFLEVSQRRRKNPTITRAAYSAGTVGLTSGKRHIRDTALAVLTGLAESKSSEEFADKARIAVAFHLIERGEAEAAIEFLEKVPEASGDYYAIAQRQIKRTKRQLDRAKKTKTDDIRGIPGKGD